MSLKPGSALLHYSLVDKLGESGNLGTIAPGARADIVAMPDDPLQDITATERVSFVMKDGIVVTR
jgi:imidazolonepropionase-like amidohydrolase